MTDSTTTPHVAVPPNASDINSWTAYTAQDSNASPAATTSPSATRLISIHPPSETYARLDQAGLLTYQTVIHHCEWTDVYVPLSAAR